MNKLLSLFEFILLIIFIDGINGGCRIQERNTCETICQWNKTNQNYECNLRAIVILPKMETVEASLPRVCYNE